MQKFTRSLTREIEVGGERLAITFSEEGLSVRPVGSRRPPGEMTWASVLCAAVGKPVADRPPTSDEVAEALTALKNIKGSKAAAPTPAPAAEALPAPTPAPSPAHAAEAPAPAPAPPHEPPPAPRPAPSAERTSPKPATAGLRSLLSRIDEWIGQHRARFNGALRPGASAAELDAAASTLHLPLPAGLRALLGWHNGQDPDVFGALESNWNLMTTDQIVEVKKDLDANPPSGWDRAWIPFLDDDNNSYVVVDTAHDGAVREVWHGQQEHPVAAPSLTAWVQKFVEGLESGAYHEDPERGSFYRK
jgi:cell wall assembly regulator SMI1